MNREKGFTLIELLAVIVVLAVIALIATPMIMDIITASRKNTIKARAQGYAYAAEAAILNLQAEGEDLSNGTVNTSKLDNYIKYDGPRVNGSVTLKNGAVIGYDLYINGYRVKKVGEEVTVELSDGQVHNEVNEIDVVRGEDTVHITNSSELQNGDVYVNGQYEYHYNATFIIDGENAGGWDIDSTLNGWSMKLTEDAIDDGVVDTVMVTEIMSKNIVNMFCLFMGSQATSIDLSSFDTSNVITMEGMFAGCSNLTNIDLSNFNTSNVTSMDGMFVECGSLTSLDVSGFNTSNVTSMAGMFNACGKLTELDVSGFDTSNVISMDSMFAECDMLSMIDVTKFDTSKVTSMGAMFASCNNLRRIIFGDSWDTSNVTFMNSMFAECGSLTSLDVSNFDMSSVTDMNSMFADCGSLTSLDLSSFNTSNTKMMQTVFSNCSSLTDLILPSNFINDGADTLFMFCGCSNLEYSTVSSAIPSELWNNGSCPN